MSPGRAHVASRPKARAVKRMREQAADWALRADAGALGAAERRAFEAWLARDPAHAKLYARAEAALRQSRSLLLAEPGLAATPARRKRRGTTIAVAVIGAAAALAFALDLPMRLRADAIAASGELPVIALPDGSTLQLNAVSA